MAANKLQMYIDVYPNGTGGELATIGKCTPHSNNGYI